MRQIEYKIVAGTDGLRTLESEVSSLLNKGWKTVGGIAFNQGFAYQALAKVSEKAQPHTSAKKTTQTLDNNNAMKALDDLM